MTNLKYIVMASALLLAPGLFAAEEVPGPYLMPAIGALFFDDSRRLEDEPSLTGRQKNRRVVAEITAMEMVKKRQ